LNDSTVTEAEPAAWHTAADFYRRATAEYYLHNSTTEPYLSEARQAQASLAECERAVQR
jgi:hypothetical protein